MRSARTALAVGFVLVTCPNLLAGDLIQLGTPERVFSMDDFSSIANKTLNDIDVTSNGSHIAFTTHPYCGSARAYTYQLDGQSGQPMPIDPGAGEAQSLCFSRDNAKLYFGYWDYLEEDRDYDIWEANIDGTNVSPFITKEGSQGRPTPVVVNGQDRIVYGDGHWPRDLWSCDTSGGDRVRLTYEGNVNCPRASSDGSQFVYHSQDTNDYHDLYIMNSDGTGGRPITNDGLVTEEGWPNLAKNAAGQEIVIYERMNPSTSRTELWATDLLAPGDPDKLFQLLVADSVDLHSFDYVPDDPSSPFGAIYYLTVPPPCGLSDVWRVPIIPEPATLSLLALGGLALLRRRHLGLS